MSLSQSPGPGNVSRYVAKADCHCKIKLRTLTLIMLVGPMASQGSLEGAEVSMT